jgi:hypothetical protein
MPWNIFQNFSKTYFFLFFLFHLFIEEFKLDCCHKIQNEKRSSKDHHYKVQVKDNSPTLSFSNYVHLISPSFERDDAEDQKAGVC